MLVVYIFREYYMLSAPSLCEIMHTTTDNPLVVNQEALLDPFILTICEYFHIPPVLPLSLPHCTLVLIETAEERTRNQRHSTINALTLECSNL